MEENLARIEEFHAKITSLEDELNEARLETSRVKTEQINERSAKDIKLSELQTKINEVHSIQFNSIRCSFMTDPSIDRVCFMSSWRRTRSWPWAAAGSLERGLAWNWPGRRSVTNNSESSRKHQHWPEISAKPCWKYANVSLLIQRIKSIMTLIPVNNCFDLSLTPVT